MEQEAVGFSDVSDGGRTLSINTVPLHASLKQSGLCPVQKASTDFDAADQAIVVAPHYPNSVFSAAPAHQLSQQFEPNPEVKDEAMIAQFSLANHLIASLFHFPIFTSYNINLAMSTASP
jgi:hypothetical protein